MSMSDLCPLHLNTCKHTIGNAAPCGRLCFWCSLLMSFFSPFLSRVRTPPQWCHTPSPCLSPCLSNPVVQPRCAGGDRGDALACLQPPDTLRSTAACCTKKQLSVKIERSLRVTVSVVCTTPLRPCFVLSGQDKGCTAPLPPGGNRERTLYSCATHKVRYISTNITKF